MIVWSCSDDAINDDASLNQNFDTETVYKGIFTNIEGTKRGKIEMRVDAENMATALLTLHTGATIELMNASALFKNEQPVLFTSMGNTEASWQLTTDRNGNNPVISNVLLDNEPGDVLMARATAAAPVTPITGTYECFNCDLVGVGFPTTNLTWNMMSVGEGDSQNFLTQVAYGGRIYNTTNTMQANCITGAAVSDCEIDGSFNILGYEVNFAGIHQYGTLVDCSYVSGVWSAENYGIPPGANGSFVSDSDCSEVVLMDIDGNTYDFATIGNQEWMLGNLNVSHYRNGDEIPHVEDPAEWANLTTGAWTYNMNDTANGPIYGKLYNWYAVNDPRGIAPEGWHVSTNEDWNILVAYAGGDAIAGGKLKSTTGWTAPNTGASDEYGFASLPGESCSDLGAFLAPGASGYWWTSDSNDVDNAWYRGMYHNEESINNNFVFKKYGFSVRCVKN